VIIPAALASTSDYCTFSTVFGWKPLFTIPAGVSEILTFNNPLALVLYLILALFLVVLAAIYTRTFYGLTHLFHRLPFRPHFRPALGAFLTGLVGLVLYFVFGDQVLAVLSFGYGILQDVMSLPAADPPGLTVALMLLAVAGGKILTTGLTIGSGGSGGVFGPSMVIGGCAGGALGIVFQRFWPGIVPHPASFAIVGMAGFFAAAAKTPFSTLVIVSEMTGNYSLLLPTLWVCTLAFLLSDEQSIYSSQVLSRSLSPAHQGDYVREVLAGLFVRHYVKPQADTFTLRPSDRLADVLARLGQTPFQTVPVADAEGRLLGVVSLEEVHLASQSPNLSPLVVAADLMRSDVTPLQLDDRLDRAQELFVENDLLALPVVDNLVNRRVLGIVKRSDIAGAYLRHVHGESNRNDFAEPAKD
jgi:CIC family chloride channel protein